MPDAAAIGAALFRHGPGRARHRQPRNARRGLLSPPGGADLANPAGLYGRVAARLDRAPDGPLAIGFSGGGDSAALLHIAADWARQRARPLIPLIVDHALRPGSADDAARAAAQAAALGLEPRVLRWEGPKPDSGVQQAARAARLRLLAGAARQAGAAAVLLAHTRDDQAETVWLRAASGSGWRGLAAMAPGAPFPLWPEGRGLIALRPLLNVSRAALRTALRARGADWINDPANDDPRHARVRARRALARLPQAADRLLSIADHARALGEAEAALARGLAARTVEAPPDGTLRLMRAGLAAPGAARLLQAALAAAAGVQRPAPMDAVEALLARLGRGEGGTLGGAGAAPHGHIFVIHRDAGAVLGRPGVPPAPPLTLQPGAPTVWDGRFAITAQEAGLQVRPLGDAWRELPDASREAVKATPEAARAALPGLWRDGRLACAPTAGYGAGLADLQPLALERLQRLLFQGFACSYGADMDA